MHKTFVLILFVTYKSISISWENCFYLQSVTYASNNPYSTLPTGYTMQAVWDTEQMGITKYSYYLIGFQIHHLPNPILTFDASLTNVTSTSATFTFNPYNNSAIHYISFTIILLKQTTGIVELLYLEYNTMNFYIANHTADIENLKVYISTTFQRNVSNYKSQFMLSSFQIASALNIFKLWIGAYAINLNDNFQQIQLGSDAVYQNQIFKICFTYVMFEIYSLNYTIIFCSQYEVINTNYHVLNVSSQFQPNPSRKCFFGINRIMSNFLARNVSTVIYLQGSNSVNFMNSDYNQYYKLCIQTCPRNYFANYAISEVDCYPCEQNLVNCYLCSSLTVCQQCINDYFLMPLTMKCHRVCPDGFYGNTITLKCESCLNSTIYILMGNGTCGCQTGYRMLNSICTNITGCMSLAYESYVSVCKFCNLIDGFETVNGSCQCATGFSLLSTTCTEICGDGLLFRLACDDGNTQNRDGCSSTCQLEENYVCTKGSSSNASVCTYLKHDITLSLKRIEKVDLMNQGIFTFQLYPIIYSMNRLNLTRDVIFSCIPNQTISSMSLSNGLLVIYVDFYQDLEGKEANVTLLLQNSYFLQAQVKTTFTMSSNGMKLLVTKDKVKMLMCKESIEIVSLVIVIIFFLASLTHKMIGVQMIHSFQVIYLVHLLNDDYTQLYSFLRLFSFTVFDFLAAKNNLSAVASTNTKVAFGKANLKLSITLIVGFSAASIFLFMLASLLLRIKQKNKENFQQKHSKQFVDISLILKYSYNHLLFPIVISTLLVSLVVLDSNNQQLIPKIFSYACAFQTFLSSALFFYEFKAIFIDQSRKQMFLGVKYCKRQYISHYLLLTFAVSFILSLSLQRQKILVQFILIALYGSFLIYLIICRPYSSNCHNFGIITNVVLLIYFLSWSGLKSYRLINQSENNQLFAFFIFVLLSIVAMLNTLVRIMHEILKVITVLRQKYFSKNNNEQRSFIQRQQIEKVEIKQEEFLKKIAKANLKDVRYIDPFLFVPTKNKARDNAKELLKMNLRSRLRERQAVMNNRDSLL